MNTNLISRRITSLNSPSFTADEFEDAIVDAYKKNKTSSLLMDSVRARRLEDYRE